MRRASSATSIVPGPLFLPLFALTLNPEAVYARGKTQKAISVGIRLSRPVPQPAVVGNFGLNASEGQFDRCPVSHPIPVKNQAIPGIPAPAGFFAHPNHAFLRVPFFIAKNRFGPAPLSRENGNSRTHQSPKNHKKDRILSNFIKIGGPRDFQRPRKPLSNVPFRPRDHQGLRLPARMR